MKFETGDIVEINQLATIADMSANHWNGCQIHTLDFLAKYADSGKRFEIERVGCGHCELKGIFYRNGDELLVNENVLKLVRETSKEMTLTQICDELGYEIKTVKEND
ncbi:MAG: hypothetical protein HFH45_03475 [Bacilli bacterium]|nr:hypothetical protein [Bacilli bacterium]